VALADLECAMILAKLADGLAGGGDYVERVRSQLGND